MHASLSRLAALPGDTLVYCAHEYTASNLRFARKVEPNSAALARREAEVAALRAAHRPTVPSSIAVERATNPFLRVDHPDVQRAAQAYSDRPLADAATILGAVRHWKDSAR
jgi:hydroxyacylglutathione hydrolase